MFPLGIFMHIQFLKFLQLCDIEERYNQLCIRNLKLSKTHLYGLDWFEIVDIYSLIYANLLLMVYGTEIYPIV